MQEKYYVSNPLSTELWVEDNLVPEFAVRKLIPISFKKAVELKGLGWTVIKQDEDTEAGIAPENNNEGGNSGATSIDVNFVGDPDNNGIFQFELKGLPYYVNIHTTAPDPENPDNETVLYIQLGDGAHGERHTLQFTTDTESQEKPTISGNNLYDSTGTIRFDDVDCSWNWIEIEYDARGNNWKVINWENNMRNLPQRPLYGVAQGKKVLNSRGSYNGGFGTGFYHPNVRYEIFMDNNEEQDEDSNFPVVDGYFRIPDYGISGQRLTVVVTDMTNNGNDLVHILQQGGNGIVDKDNAAVTNIIVHNGNCSVVLDWDENLYKWRLVDYSGGDTVTFDV